MKTWVFAKDESSFRDVVVDAALAGDVRFVDHASQLDDFRPGDRWVATFDCFLHPRSDELQEAKHTAEFGRRQE